MRFTLVLRLTPHPPVPNPVRCVAARHPGRALTPLVTVALVGALVSAPCAAQVTSDTSRVARDTLRIPDRARQGVPPTADDSTRPPLSAGRAFLYSFLLPGLGQSRLERHMAGTLYFTVEAVALALLAKSANDLRIARAHQNDVVVNRYQVDPTTGAPILVDGAPVAQDSVRSRYNEERVRARRTHVEDWIAILVFNHLFAGADALVSSLLWDVPIRVGLRPAPAGPSAGLGFSVRW